MNYLRDMANIYDEMRFMIYENAMDAQYMDAQYMDAVKRGDMKTAQQMINDKAKSLGASIYYRGGASFTTADMRKPYIWLAETREYAKKYGTPFQKFVFCKNPLDLTEFGDDLIYRMSRNDIVNMFLSKNIQIDPEKININKLGGGEPFFRVLTLDGEAYFKNMLMDNGYDAIKFLESRAPETPPAESVIAVFKPSQIKLSNAVTKDDKKNIIPISQRLDEHNDDIRY